MRRAITPAPRWFRQPARATTHHCTWAETESRARRLVRVLQGLGVEAQDRVGTLAWNDYRHLEIYYAASGMQAICHTINPRLAPDDIAYIINDAGDSVLFVDPGFAPLIGGIAAKIKDNVRAVVMMTDAAGMPALDLPGGMRLLCYDELMDAADDDYTWPNFDENTASALCYTSGTTGRPKGVLYSHRSTVIHAYAIALPDVLSLRATSRILPVVPMFHVNAWGIPYATALTGAALVLPGRHLDGASLARLLNQERVTMTCGVPTVWLGLLQHLRASGEKLATVKRIMTGGSAAPPLLIEAFRDEFGVAVEHGWGMTELSPVGTYNAPKPAQTGLAGDAAVRHMLKQGRILPGIDMKIVDGDGRELPWDGMQFGDLLVRGPWVCSGYYGEAAGQRLRRRRLVRHRRRRDDRSRRLHGDHRPVEGCDQVGRRVDQFDHAGEHRRLASRRCRGRGRRGQPPEVGRAAVAAGGAAARPYGRSGVRAADLSGPGAEMVAAGRRRGGARAAAYGDGQAAQDEPASPLSRLLSKGADIRAATR